MADEKDKAAEAEAAKAKDKPEPETAPEGTTTMTVAKGFTLTLVHGKSVHYKAGIHKNVPVAHADHWYTKAHLASEDEAEG